MTNHRGEIPSKNAPNTSAIIPPIATDDASQNPRGSSCIVDLPNPFLEPASSPPAAVNSTAVVASHPLPATAVDLSSAPGMARNAREQNSEPLDIPPFLRRARPAHDAIEPECVGGVIPIARANNVATGEREC